MKQKYLINLLTIITVFAGMFIVNTSLVSASKAPDQFVINEQSKQCGTYCSGDEFSYTKLPSGWKIYEPIKSLILETPFGTCNGEYVDQEQYYQACAKQIGYKYVDFKNVPYTTNDVSKFGENDWKCSPDAGKHYYQGFIVNETRKELTTLIDFSLRKTNTTAYPTEDQCNITDKNWVAYEYRESYEMYAYKMITPIGECNNFNDLDHKTCCSQLGLAYVDDNLVATEDKNLNQIIILAIIGTLALASVAVTFGRIWFKKYKNKQRPSRNSRKTINKRGAKRA